MFVYQLAACYGFIWTPSTKQKIFNPYNRSKQHKQQ